VAFGEMMYVNVAGATLGHNFYVNIVTAAWKAFKPKAHINLNLKIQSLPQRTQHVSMTTISWEHDRCHSKPINNHGQNAEFPSQKPLVSTVTTAHEMCLHHSHPIALIQHKKAKWWGQPW
jgi:hypothetical protein